MKISHKIGEFVKRTEFLKTANLSLRQVYLMNKILLLEIPSKFLIFANFLDLSTLTKSLWNSTSADVVEEREEDT
jgi:hypothetical protein